MRLHVWSQFFTTSLERLFHRWISRHLREVFSDIWTLLLFSHDVLISAVHHTQLCQHLLFGASTLLILFEKGEKKGENGKRVSSLIGGYGRKGRTGRDVAEGITQRASISCLLGLS